MNAKYKILSKKKLHDGFFKLHELSFTHKKHNGKWSPVIKREVFSGAHVASILPYDPIKNEIILIEQFRHGTLGRSSSPIMLEIVAGMIDEGETPVEAALRECTEEIGCAAKNIKEIFSYYPAPGSSESYYHFFFAEVDAFEGEKIMGEVNENEDILVKSYPVKLVREFLKEKKIKNAATLLALQWFFLEYHNS